MGAETLQIIEMTREYAELIATWRYDGEYSLYNESEENIDGLMNGMHYACTDARGELIGYFCFGEDARISTIEDDIYDGDFLDIGLGLRPSLCGKNLGLSFFIAGLEYARDVHGTCSFRLSVAAFNERAIKVYRRAGFCVEQEVTHSDTGTKFLIMKRKHSFLG